MKKIFMMLAIAMLSTTNINALSAKESAMPQKEQKTKSSTLNKDAKTEAKRLRKEGWEVPAGELSLEQQLMVSYQYRMETTTDEDNNKTNRFIAETAQQTAGTYNAAYAAARSNAQVNLAAMIKMQVAAAMQAKIDNDQATSITVVTIDKFNQRSKAIVDETLTNSIPLVTIYRRLPNNTFEIQVRMAFDKKELAARLKRNMQRELEAEGDELNKIVNEVISNHFK